MLFSVEKAIGVDININSSELLFEFHYMSELNREYKQVSFNKCVNIYVNKLGQLSIAELQWQQDDQLDVLSLKDTTKVDDLSSSHQMWQPGCSLVVKLADWEQFHHPFWDT